jgi:LDH2 family malate/lactate/ureidoglycolate dehydrogenase
MTEITIKVENLHAFIIDLTTKTGLTKSDADILAASLIDADLKGIRSHGLIRLPTYIRRMESGVIDTAKKVEVVKEKGSIKILNANHGLGQVAGMRGMEMAMTVAKQFGVGICGIFNSNHFGALGYYTELASKAEMIGLAITNTFPIMAPVGGKEKVIGNNPFAISVPRSRDFPITYDVATSAVAYGKIMVAQREAKKIPLGWALDSEGTPTDNPDEVILRNGSLTPFEKHKGYGLAFVLEILAGVLTGSSFGRQIHSMFDLKELAGLGHFMMAIDVEYFIELENFYDRLEQFVQSIKFSRLAKGAEEILIPGEAEHKNKRVNVEKGLAYDLSLIEEINILAKKYSCPSLT